jgi:hypothetical protein
MKESQFTCEPNSRVVLVMNDETLIPGVFSKVGNGLIWITEDRLVTNPLFMNDYKASGFEIGRVRTWYYDIDPDLGI